MPFSWKKTRRNRFSQLVADHLQSPKRGGSLVVETGFPTSLIDLYVRNRGRFRKSYMRDDDDSGLIVDSDNMQSLNSSFVSSSGGLDEIIEEDEVAVKIKTQVEMAKKLNPVLVVVLVLGTKRFMIGITMSAFLLLLLELLLRSESRFHKENTTRGQVLEIEEQEEVRSEKELDEARRSEVLMEEIKHKTSRMKLKMKKLVPKKLLRKSSKEDNISYRIIEEEEETVKSAQDHNKTIVLSSECSDSKGKTLKQNEDKIDGRALSSEIDKNSGCLVLRLVVLIGLIGGRALAVALALSWCLIVNKKLQWRNVKFPIS